jgi:hypothetical protein
VVRALPLFCGLKCLHPHFPTKQEGEFLGKGELPVHTHIGYFSLCISFSVFTFSFNNSVKCKVLASSGADGEEGNLAKRGGFHPKISLYFMYVPGYSSRTVPYILQPE